jgi:hypothetical protein
MKFVDHDPVDLPHLRNGHGRDDAHTVLAYTFTAPELMTKSPWSRNLHPRRRLGHTLALLRASLQRVPTATVAATAATSSHHRRTAAR